MLTSNEKLDELALELLSNCCSVPAHLECNGFGLVCLTGLVTIQRKYSLPNCTLQRGLSEATTGMQSTEVRPYLNVGECGCYLTASKQPLSGGGLLNPGDAVSSYVRNFFK